MCILFREKNGYVSRNHWKFGKGNFGAQQGNYSMNSMLHLNIMFLSFPLPFFFSSILKWIYFIWHSLLYRITGLDFIGFNIGFIYLSTSLHIYLSIYLSINLYVYPSIYPFIQGPLSIYCRYWGEDEFDRVSVTSRKMITYTRVDCVGASKEYIQ